MNVFTKEEAMSKIGKKVKARMFVHGLRAVPPDTIGELVEVDSFGGVWMVSVEWILQREVPLVDWFNKPQYEQYLEEI